MQPTVGPDGSCSWDGFISSKLALLDSQFIPVKSLRSVCFILFILLSFTFIRLFGPLIQNEMYKKTLISKDDYQQMILSTITQLQEQSEV